MRVAPPTHNLRGAMDYCHQCRRHLNGALTCAGCGTPAEELRQQAPPSPGSHHSRHPGEDDQGEEDHGEYADASDGEIVLTGRHPEPEPEGRRGSRRRKAPARPRTKPRRARSTRRRKVLIATFGVLLSLATLGLAELAMESTGKDHATTVKEETSVDFDGGPRDTERPAVPDDPGPAPSADPGATGSARPGGSGEPGATGSAEASASPSASEGEGSPDPSVSGSPGPDGSTPGTTGPSGPTGGPTSDGPTTQAPPPPPEPEPEPEPTETCTWWLFFCT
ncbi:hypothetical protein ACFYYH_25655 [Streptomyces sp. NPDC002018]|uniref:SCO2400 family protein n=1 Tax=Streptomyces sp. NPDC002018 TaxID=3364629 RepID=UPI0036AD1372